MSKWLRMTPLLAACFLRAQTAFPIPTIVPMTPVGGFVIPSGTALDVRVDQRLSSDTSKEGDAFTATLVNPVMVNGHVVLTTGTQLTGHVSANVAAGVFKGQAQLVLALDAVKLGRHSFAIELTSATLEAAEKHRKLENPDPNAKAVVGNRLSVTIPAETVVHFTLGSPVRV